MRTATALALLACLALLVGGCGSSGPGAARSTGAATTAAGANAPDASVEHPPSIAEEEAQAGDHSIQSYGTEAKGSEAEAVVAAMRSFFRAMAAPDYANACAGLTSSNREQLAQFAKIKKEPAKGCASQLATVLVPGASPAAKKAAVAKISRVRIGGGNAFILFRPAGGQLSYFVMKEEGGQWKATSLTAGTPLHP
jgi:hypothetical protein